MQHHDLIPCELIWCAIPVYNNKGTVRRIAEECRAILRNVVVIDDGSTDTDISGLLAGLDVVVLKHEKNLGKGRAILTASRYIENSGGMYMITIDADGQHLPSDIRKFTPLMRRDEPSLIIGCRNFKTANVPTSSRFGRLFANFWLMVETGQVVPDCQSGFRAYPVHYLNLLRFRGSHYDFEAEILARAAWAGLQFKTVNIDVLYPKPGERVSSFRPFLDNLRLTHTHAMMVSRRMMPVRHKKLFENGSSGYGSLLRHPGKALKMLLQESATPQGLALSAAVGLFIAVLPILFMHSIVILYVSLRFNLNKFVSLNVQHLAVPPFIPALCIEVGYFLRHGRWLTDLSYETVFKEFSSRIFEWFLGSLIIAPLAALLIGAVMYVTASVIKKVWWIHVSSKESS
jgi:glycosyltransferase involved in cell wall biosynthesis